MDYREISLDELKKIELNLLVEFDKICRKEGLRYSLGGGTLLGAIRHKGFIPWDDDIDVMMPRSDYNKFFDYCKNNITPFQSCCYENDKDYISLFGKLFAKDTIIEESLNASTSRGIFIDVFPLDGLANTYPNAVKQFNKTSFYRELMVAKMWNTFARSKTHAWYYEPVRFALFLLSRPLNAKKMLRKIDKINCSIDFENSKYAACVCGSYRLKEIVETSDLLEYIYVPFEQYQFPIIKGYDNYLKKHYGDDYMSLPPIEKRGSRHKVKAYVKI